MNFDNIYTGISNEFCVDEDFLNDILTTLEFRINKNHYHFNKIRDYVDNGGILNEEYIYYESENLIINIRSTVDNLLLLINNLYDMGFSNININLKNILHSKKCTNALKDTFLLHTHPKNQFWKFIYTTRNEIVHEYCIKSKFPIVVDEEYINKKCKYTLYYINSNGDKENAIFVYQQCIKLIDELCDSVLHVLSKGLK